MRTPSEKNLPMRKDLEKEVIKRCSKRKNKKGKRKRNPKIGESSLKRITCTEEKKPAPD